MDPYHTKLLYCAGGRKQTFEDIFQSGPNLKSEKLIMRGPGGRGEVEVAVSAVPGIITRGPSFLGSWLPQKLEKCWPIEGPIIAVMLFCVLGSPFVLSGLQHG